MSEENKKILKGYQKNYSEAKSLNIRVNKIILTVYIVIYTN